MPIPKQKSGEGNDAFIERCMSNETMKKEYSDNDQRFAVCSQQLKSNEASPKHLHRAEFFAIQGRINQSDIRRGMYHGVEHLVVPMVMLIEGVLWPSNAEGPELALAEEFGRFPAGWNGRPVVLGHPIIDGAPVSANSPSVLEEYAFGFLFNTQLKNTKLLSEAWINLDRVDDLGGDFKATVDRLEASTELVEVSTGLFSMNEDATGDFNGEDYTAIWRNIVPDHLAILPEGVKGACSVEDGCGAPRASGAASYPGSSDLGSFLSKQQNSTEGVMSDTQSQCECGGKGKETPATTNSGAVNLGKGGGAETDPPATTQEGIFKSLISRFGDMLSFRSNQNDLSDRDTRTALDAALSAVDNDKYHYIIAVFEDFFVYEEGFDYTLLRRGYSISEDSSIALTDDAVQVRPVTTFVPLEASTSTPGSTPTMSTTAEEATMDKTAKIEALISNESAPFDETDKEYLNDLEENKLSALSDKFIARDNGEGTGEVTGEGAAATAQTTDKGTETQTPAANSQTQSQPKQPSTLDEYINAAPPEMRDVLKASHSLHQRKRNGLIDQIKANSHNKFSEQQLKEMDLGMLENLASLAGVETDYSGAGAGALRDQSTADQEAAIPSPPKLFEVNSQAS